MEKKKYELVDIDLQKDFVSAAAVEALREKIKAIDFKKLSENIPLKTMRHGQSDMNTIPLFPFDQSGSMGSILSHEMDHGNIYKKEIPEKDFNKDFNIYAKDKIFTFDEIRKTDHAALTKKFDEFRATLVGIFAGAEGSRSRGEELAESFQQGAAQAVAVRKPFSFRPHAQASS